MLGSRKREPPQPSVRPERSSLRDLENPTHAFPIGAMSRTGASRRRSIGADDTVELAKFPAPHRGDDDYEVSDNPLPRAPAVDARLVILWLALAVFLVVLVGLAVAVAVQYL